MKAIIIAGGTPPSKKLITKEITKKSIIIAVDSGANCLWQYKVTPHYLIGDLDSIDYKILNFLLSKNVTIERYPVDKDCTDAELALKKAQKLKIKKITFLGCLGGNRVDHLLGTIGLLDECANSNIAACLKDDYQTISLLKKSTTIYGKPGQMFSLQAYGGTIKNLSLTGSKYTLNNYSLKMGDALTLSNEFCDKEVRIKFKSGKMLLMIFASKN
jgi:thiamine pyrophosphokinase